MSVYLIICIIFICLIVEALYSGGEIALISSDINKIRFFARRGSFSARQALKLMEKPEWFISTTIIGTNLAIVTSSTLTTGILVAAFGPARGAQMSLIIMLPTLFVMIIARSIFQNFAETLAMKVAIFIRVSSVLFYPLAYVIAAVSKETVRFSTGQNVKKPSYITKEGLKYILRKKTQGSDILKTEREMVSRVFDFSEATVDKIMIPLSAMTALPITTNIEEAARIVASKKYLRIPVYQGQIFNIVGILHYFDLLAVMHNIQDKAAAFPLDDTIASCLRGEVFYVPETKKARELLMDMQKRREHMAIVVDEYGGAVGIVTIEDIGEEIIGSIDDEYTTGEKLYKRISPGRYLVNGRISIESLSELIAMKIPSGNYETVGGFLMHKTGRIPKRKESLDYNGITYIIENADQKSIKEVLVIFPAQLDKELIKKQEG
jgi:CBS domain containing-hemolysin-like protein